MTTPAGDISQTCGRRMTDWGPWERAENLDRWTTGHGLAGQDAVGKSCSFCGSLHPDRFLELVADGWIIEPTDKNYKAYLKQPYTDAEKSARKATWLRSDAVAKATRELGTRDGKTAAQIDADLEDAWASGLGQLSDGRTVAKFYFQHLSPAQRNEFIALYNDGRMKVSGGGFYVAPYFTKPQEATP